MWKTKTLLRKSQGMPGLLLIILILIVGGCQRVPATIETPDIRTENSPNNVQRTTIKIITKNPGMYRLTDKELRKSGIQDLLNESTQLHLYNLGNGKQFWIDNEGGEAALTFYAEAPDSVYSDENVYWLTNDDRLEESLSWKAKDSGIDFGEGVTETNQIENEPKILKEGYFAVQRFEQNKIYSPLVEEGDHWFWDRISGKQKKNYRLALEDVLKGTAELRIAIWSATRSDVEPDHHMVITVNGQVIIDKTWDGSGGQIFSSEIPDGVLKSGENQVEIFVPGDIGVRAETNHINWIEFVYPRQLIAINDQLEFIANQEINTISGLSKNIAVFDITDRMDIKQLLTNGDTEKGVFSFEGEPGKKLLVIGDKGYLSPAGLEIASLNPDLRANTSGADWVAIGPEDLLEAVQPLAEWREKNGLSARTIDVNLIYDQFGYGMPEPDAIRKFIVYAIENWKPAPQYLLLVGDASYDPKGYLQGTQINRLPSFLIQTNGSGQTASDVKFIELEAENDQISLMNLAIGRLPAQTAKQVKIIVEKIIQYESTESTGGSPSILAVADGQELSFAEDARSFLKIFPDERYKTILLAPEAGATDTAQQIVVNIKQNDFLVVYFGHGSINMWGKDSLFSNDNVKDLSNLEHYPVMLNFTCLTGLFSHPEQESLAEALLWQADGGVVAMIAPTSLTLAADQSYLSKPLATAFVETPDSSLGTLLHQVRIEMTNRGEGVREVMETFLLFGDPATKLTMP